MASLLKSQPPQQHGWRRRPRTAATAPARPGTARSTLTTLPTVIEPLVLVDARWRTDSISPDVLCLPPGVVRQLLERKRAPRRCRSRCGACRGAGGWRRSTRGSLRGRESSLRRRPLLVRIASRSSAGRRPWRRRPWPAIVASSLRSSSMRNRWACVEPIRAFERGRRFRCPSRRVPRRSAGARRPAIGRGGSRPSAIGRVAAVARGRR